MHEPLEAGGLEAAAVELLHLGVDGDGEAHVQPGSHGPARQLLPLPPARPRPALRTAGRGRCPLVLPVSAAVSVVSRLCPADRLPLAGRVVVAVLKIFRKKLSRSKRF